MANWEAMNSNIGNIFSSLGSRAKEGMDLQQQIQLYNMQRHAELQDAIKLATKKAELERADPMWRFKKAVEMVDGYQKMGMDAPPGLREYAMSGMQQEQDTLMQTQPSSQMQTSQFQVQPKQSIQLQQSPNMVATDYERTAFGEFRPKKFTDLEAEKKKELAKGISSGETGRVTLAKESLRNIEDIKGMLFKDGKLNRELAFGSNPPAVRLPFIGRIGANVRRDNPLDPTDNKKARASQAIFRKIGSALSGRQLIQTGVAARPEEKQKLIEEYAPGVFSSSESALDGLNELQDFYKTYIYLAETRGLQDAEEWAKLQGTPGNVIGSIEQPNQSSDIDQKIKRALEANYTQEEINEYLYGGR